MDILWYLIGDLFRFFFKAVPFLGGFFNLLLIAIGFIAFFSWLKYMADHKTVEKFD